LDKADGMKQKTERKGFKTGWPIKTETAFENVAGRDNPIAIGTNASY